MVEVYLGAGHYFIDGLGEEGEHFVDHRLVLHAFGILAGEFVVLLVGVEGGEGVVVDQRDEETKGWEGQFAILPDQCHHHLHRRLISYHLYHLLPVLDEIVLVHRLYQHRTQVLDHRGTAC